MYAVKTSGKGKVLVHSSALDMAARANELRPTSGPELTPVLLAGRPVLPADLLTRPRNGVVAGTR